MIELSLKIYIGIDGFWCPCEKFTEIHEDGYGTDLVYLNDLLHEALNDDSCVNPPNEGIGFYKATFSLEPGGDDGSISHTDTGYMLEINKLEYIGDKK